jgi:DinB superfamily
MEVSMVGELIAQVSDARARAVLAVQSLTQEQAAAKASETEWSVNEVLEHLVLAEQSGVSKIWAATDGVRRGRPVWSGVHTNLGMDIDAVIAQTWKEKETAPPIATPHIGGPKEYWVECLKYCQPVLEKLGSSLQEVDLETVIFPHFLSGPLDARQRLQFLRFHIDRHIHQIERIMKTEKFLAA